MIARDSSSQCLQSFMMEHNHATVILKVVRVLSVMIGAVNVYANLTLSVEDVTDVHLELTDSDLQDADLVTATPVDLVTISVTKPVVSALAVPVYPDEDATNVNQVTSASLSVPDVTATVMPTYATKTLVYVYTAPDSLLETIAKCARKVTMATHFWEAMTNANHVCAPMDQVATDSLLMDAEKTTSSTELYATVWKDMQVRCVISVPLHTGEIPMNPTACAVNATATIMSTHWIQTHVTHALESAPDASTTLLDLTAKDAEISTTEVHSTSAAKCALATCWALSYQLASGTNVAAMS